MKNDVSLAEIMSRLDKMGSDIKKELQDINVKINRLEERIGKIEKRIGSIEEDVSGIKVRGGSVEVAVKENKRCIEDNTNLLVKFSYDVKERFDDISTAIRMLTGYLNETHGIAIDNRDNIRKLNNIRHKPS